MPNIVSVLKAEIARICRKELRAEIGGLRKASANYRREIAALKRQIAELRREAASTAKRAIKADDAAAPAPKSKLRFQAKGLQTLRTRLGLSREAFAKLAGVSAQSIYNWERGTATPRAAQLEALAQVRGLGKREASAMLSPARKRRSTPR